MNIEEEAGRFVYVVDLDETIHIAPDAPHAHPTILGGAQEARYAGEIIIDRPGCVGEITNLSGTFQFNDQQSLCCVAMHVRNLGDTVDEVMWYPADGSTGPKRLTC